MSTDRLSVTRPRFSTDRTQRRSLAAYLAIALVAAACSTTGPIETPAATWNTALTLPPIATESATATPGPTSTPAPAETPLPEVRFSKLTYNPNACWTQGWQLTDGHLVDGIRVSLSVTAESLHDGWTPHVWFLVEATDSLSVPMYSSTVSWKGASKDPAPNGVIVGGITLKPHVKTKLSWKVLIATPFDAHYRVSAIVGATKDYVNSLPAFGLGDHAMSVWNDVYTTNRVC